MKHGMPGQLNRSQLQTQCVLCLTAVIFFSGCGSSGIPLGAVSGRVTSGGKPKPGINVLFQPVAGGRGSQGSTDESGYYELSFAGGRKGAVLGQHDVTVEVKARYNDADIVVKPAQKFISAQREVQSGSNVFDFEIDEAHAKK
jgi:hypothetical protein